MLLNPKLFEINIRVWLRKNNLRINEIPVSFFRNLKNKGIDIIWLMGVWKTNENIVEKYCFTPDLISSYNKALKDWRNEDVAGSPYAIDKYIVNPLLGTIDDLLKLKRKINDEGLKFFLDFVPNHFSVGSELLHQNPDLFLKGDEELLQRDPFTFFKDEVTGQIFAHGRDPLFSAWQDTVQVNFF